MLSTPTFPLEDRKFALKKSIALLCEEFGIDVTFMQSRRRSDTVICVLNGARDVLLTLPQKILENLEREYIEVISSKQTEQGYLLQFVITQGRQGKVSQAPERRAKSLARA